MTKAKYKSSGAEWIERLPEHWDEKPAFSVFDELDDKNELGRVQNVLSLSYGKIVRRDVESNFGLLPESFSTYQIVRAGDIVLRLLDLQNDHVSLRVGLVPEEGIVTSAYLAVRPKNRLDSRFAAYLLHAYDIKKVFYSFGGGCRQSMGFEDLRRLPIPLPSPAEQRRIADYLDAATGKIDRLVALRRRQMELLQEQRAALIQQAVTRGLDPNAPLKDSGLSWLGRCPTDWKLTPIKRLLSRIDYGTSEATNSEGKIRILTMGNIQDGEITLPNSGGLDIVPDNLLLEKNDLLFTRTNGNPELVGKVGLFRGDVSDRVSFASYLVRLRVHRLHNPEWLHLVLNSSAFWPYARGHALVNLQTNLNSTRYVQFAIPVPPRGEQDAILAHIQRETAKLDDLHQSYERQLELLGEYRAALIHEAVTGQKAVLEEGVSAETGREANVHFRRSVLGAEIIHRLHNDAKFGRVKLEKLLYLSEAFAGMDLQGHYLRAAAGPFDNFALRSVESQIQRQGWYRSVKEDKRTRYVPLAKAGGHQTYFAEYWQEQKPKFEQLMELLRPATTQQCEIVATLFAAWNDRLAAGKKSDDDDLVDEVLKNWHPDKQKIERERWISALGWMREHRIIPVGTHVTTHGKSKGKGWRIVPEALAGGAGNDP